MRRTARPFITEYKSLSSKPSATHSPNIDSAGKPDPIPAFLYRSAFVTPQINTEEAYQIALKAADALFGKGSSVTLLQEQTPSSAVPEGRVLPSLIDNDAAITVRSGKDDEKARRKSKVPTAKGSSSPGREKLPLRLLKAAEPDIVAEPAEKVTASHRERSSIQKRWVLGTELKSGQKWKRRFCKAAR